MTEDIEWFVGFDWASQTHVVCLLDRNGETVGERKVAHGGADLSELCDWLVARSGAPPARIGVAIETPHGPVVETLLERGFAVFAINPKQLDRFRDRFTVAGAKDDRRDGHVLADSLRTDRRAFRRLAVDDPTLVELREWSRIAEELSQERSRLANRIRQQLWRYYPQMLQVADDLTAENFLALWEFAPTPAKAARIDEAGLAKVLKDHRVRRIGAAETLRILRQTPLEVGGSPYQDRRRTGAIGQPPDQGGRAEARGALRAPRTEGRWRTGERAGAEVRAARRDDPALLAGGGKDQSRHAARRGRGAPAAPRLSGPAGLVRRRPGHPPQRQSAPGGAPPALSRSGTESCISYNHGFPRR